MSYEGYTQYLCKDGHYWTIDCYYDDGPQKCPTCGEEAVWGNMVDETNGQYEDGERIDGYVDLVQDKYQETTCPLCGHTHIDVCTYKIPQE
jgi:predicted RNA-binding Zn-ribbon protein involved in translation (DUF1610 family)